MTAAQYMIGIDLGTTNSVVAVTRLDGDPTEGPQIELLPIPQLVAAGTVEERYSLPSFVYQGTAAEADSGSLDLPWNEAEHATFAAGEMARRNSAETPDRTVGAAKSWLCHHRVDRRQNILPWQAPADVDKISPVEASRRYLQHLAAAWNHQYPDAPFATQKVVLTVPASFDATARELTREAALQAGLPTDMVLLEEPQAAVYAWLAATGQQWRKQLRVDDVLLVVDVGGGTTDLSLVRVEQVDGELALQRQAVGHHLLVGGDNMDLTLAHHVAQQLQQQGTKLDPWQSVSLWHACRAAKESLLSADGPPTQSISIKGRGRRLIGGAVNAEVESRQLNEMLCDGFFPLCSLEDRPQKLRASGFQEVGLPYESDPAITRHLAAFLQDQGEGQAVVPTRLLLNGGVFQAAALKQRLAEVLGGWFGRTPPAPLPGEHDLNQAVARGAAYYGWAKLHGGVRIRGGTARSYYVGIETSGLAVPGAPRPLRALCVAPFGMEEGSDADVPGQQVGLVVGEPAHFRFFCSNTRKHDGPGDLIDHWTEDEMEEIDPLETLLEPDEAINEPFLPVQFQSKVTELGMLELWCASTSSDKKWKLEFSVRDEG